MSQQTANFMVLGAGFIENIAAQVDENGIGELVINEGLKLRLHPAAENWLDLLPSMLGVVIILEGGQAFDHLPDLLATLLDHTRRPLIIAVRQQYDSDTLAAVRELLPEQPEIKVFPLPDSQAAQNVLLALIYQLLS